MEIIVTTFNKMEIAIVLGTIKIIILIITLEGWGFLQVKVAICFKMPIFLIALSQICMLDQRKIILWSMVITEWALIMELLAMVWLVAT